MNQPAVYTPLESLFLFQSLLTHGVDTRAFAHVSDLLRGNALIKADNSYDPARLSPDALQHLFLLLLREEVKSEAEAGAAAGGEASSRKRKLGSPPLPTLKDAYEHIEKVPALVDRLYARYRDHMVNQIREDERAVEVVQREVLVLERSEKERMARLAAQSAAPTPPTLAPRETKPPLAAKGPSPSLGPTPQAAAALAAARKLSTPNTPVPPPRVPGSASSIAPSPATTSYLATGTQPIRPSQSPKPPTGASSVLQAPTGLPQQSPRVLQAPVQPSNQPISPRPDIAIKATDGATGPQGSAASGTLKWEKPYQPPQTTPTPPTGQFQPPIAPNTTGQPRPQPPPQQQWQQPPVPYPAQAQGSQQSQVRPPPPKSMLVPPQSAGQVPPTLQPGPPRPTGPPGSPTRPHSTTPVLPPGRPIQPQLSQPAHQTPRPIASASPTLPTGPTAPPPKWQPPPSQQQAPRPSPSGPLAPAAAQKDKPYTSPYVAQPARPPIPEHIIRQAASTPNTGRRFTGTIPMPQTPLTISPGSLTRGLGTKWATQSTPSTPNPLVGIEPESPAFEPVSPPLRHVVPPKPTPKPVVNTPTPKHLRKIGGPVPPRSQNARRSSATPSAAETRRSQSVASQIDDLAMDQPALTPRIKDEYSTPRPQEETGDTTADESIHGRSHHLTTPGSLSRFLKRKRQDTPVDPSSPASQVLWTRGFTKISEAVLSQISSHQHANLFVTAVREKYAPNYRDIVLQPQDISSIKAAIKHGNKAATAAANSLPGGDPGTSSVWLPISEDLTPPKGIVNSAQLEREMVHVFCNAIMYNPDPDRGPGPAFMKRSQDEEVEAVGYAVDQNGFVRSTQSMFVEIEKLLGDLRSAEKERSAPPPTTTATTRPGSVATPANDDTAEDEDELAADSEITSGTAKRRRIGTRG